ncbi:ABC transporter, ATP-binding protein [Bordetella bronchiseptica B18-5 (C3)]|uniref:dipeptide ABC transporter ATP-binding protein n=1 Tax=Bordetella bronchiseptica TaxID=518 RepID=UPI000460D474|nr:ABC transporter ATP-binding protein [Bordetella bronchiseptica]AWP78674.1 ABC transporter ATP-binding protein [Bordetella bronchiseptica]KDB60973.1 ABC transporter, ATP-binding protein [Bordetella bronchiseptica B18-5 (C3)]KDC40161.1 ABC transporter, ATP-binding protein [Bordetella bronchiseptica M435/02/3]KDD12257.1 ABC transporter, ATP-binding protein [Bordetella bronchiseptica MBORD731]KDD93127.1 ABC transporter, ATP-binding protein [Bordetella bronchiseptica MBORD762]
MPAPLLSIRNLCASHGPARVLHDINLDLQAGQSLGLIGESGSGKSLTALACLGLTPDGIDPVGSIRYQDIELMQLDEEGWRAVRGRKIGIVFQDPMASLNPIMTLGAQILENLKPMPGDSRAYRRARAIKLLDEVGLPDPAAMLGRHPFELSGGQQQRAMIAMTLAAEPALLIADEPTTALDVTTQAQILGLLRGIQRQRRMAMLFISHDLDAVRTMSDRVAVMCGGRLVEQGPAREVLLAPRHDYTRTLMAAHAPQPLKRRHAPASAETAIELDGVCVDYGRWKPKRALEQVTLQVRAGATLGIAGESGSGKSTLAQAIMGLLEPSAGSVRVFGLNPAARRGRRAFAATCQYVFQDTSGSLNPRRTLLQTLSEPLLARGLPRASLREHCIAMLEDVGLAPDLLARFPHQISGGQRQRVVIARALAMQPRVLICDEPVSALDASVRNQILALLARLRDQHGLTLVFIGHDLGVMASLADDILVMRRGRVVEHGEAASVFANPGHPYTRELLDASRLSDTPSPAPQARAARRQPRATTLASGFGQQALFT